MKIINLQQNTDEWKSWRRTKIGCSDLPIIMGVSPWKTPLMLYEDKVLGKETAPTSSMIRGSQLESKARDYINDKYHASYQPLVVQDDIDEWLIASLDGYDKEATPEVIEIKCPGIEAHLLALAGIVPEYYIPQVQGQMYITKKHNLMYTSYHENSQVEILVSRDDDYIEKKLIPAARAFNQRIIDFNPPEPTDRDVVEIFDLKAKEMANLYLENYAKIKALTAENDNLKSSLVSMCNAKRSRIGEANLTKVVKKGSVDYSKVPELKGINLDQYRKDPTSFWMITNGEE